MDNPRLDTTALKRFIASLSDSLHSLCNGCMVFDSGIEIVGYINVNIDKGSKLNYVLDEKVERSIDDSITYESNSFLAEKNQSDNVNVPVPDIPVSKTPGLFSNKRIAPKRKAFQIMKKQSKRKIHVPKIPKIHVLPKTASSTGPQVVVTRGKSSLYAVVKTEDNEMQMVEPGEELNNEEDDPTFDIEVELRNAGDHDYVEHFDVKTDESGVHFEQLEGDAGAGTSTEQRSSSGRAEAEGGHVPREAEDCHLQLKFVIPTKPRGSEDGAGAVQEWRQEQELDESDHGRHQPRSGDLQPPNDLPSVGDHHNLYLAEPAGKRGHRYPRKCPSIFRRVQVNSVPQVFKQESPDSPDCIYKRPTSSAGIVQTLKTGDVGGSNLQPPNGLPFVGDHQHRYLAGPAGKRAQKIHRPEVFKKALGEIENGMTLRKASNLFNIPKTTLQQHSRGKYKGIETTMANGRLLNNEEEKSLHGCIHALGMDGYEISQKTLGYFGAIVLKRSGRHMEKNKLSEKWARCFMKRHDDMTWSTLNQITNANAIQAVPQSEIDTFYRVLHEGLLVEQDPTRDADLNAAVNIPSWGDTSADPSDMSGSPSIGACEPDAASTPTTPALVHTATSVQTDSATALTLLSMSRQDY